MADKTSEETITDEELVSEILAGQRELFAQLYRRYHPRIYRLAYAMTGENPSAEDLTQEIFINLFRKLDKFAGQSGFYTWFYRLAINCSLNYRRKTDTNLISTQEQIDTPIDENAAQQVESSVLRDQLQQQISNALITLKPELRITIVLKDFEGLSYEDMAQKLNCPLGTAITRHYQAKKLLAARLQHLKGKF